SRLTKLAAVDINARVVRQSELKGALARAPRGDVFESDGDERILHYVKALPSLQSGVQPRLVLDHSLSKALTEYSGLQWLLISLAAASLALVILLSWPV